MANTLHLVGTNYSQWENPTHGGEHKTLGGENPTHGRELITPGGEHPTLDGEHFILVGEHHTFDGEHPTLLLSGTRRLTSF